MNIVENRLQALGITLGEPELPVGNYLGCKKFRELLYVSGRVSDLKGEVGTDVNEEQAKHAAHDTVLLILSIVKEGIKNLDLICGVVKLHGFIRSSSTFTKQHDILNGASDLLVEIFGENGRHARTATGVAQLPFGATVQLDIIFELKH